MANVNEWPTEGIEISLRGGGGVCLCVCVCVCVCVKFNVRRGCHAQPLINKLSD